jgi:predicted RecA/RadA family phage recombinase
MTNYVQEGDVLNHVVAGSAISSGDIVALTDIVGVAITDGAIGDTIAVQVEGVFTLAKATGAVTIGQKLYYDADNDNLTTESEGGSPWGAFVLAGKAAAPAESGDTTVNCKLG